MNYFINKELKLSSLALIVIMVMLIIGEIYLLNDFYSKSVKKDYINSIGNIYFQSIKKYPELKKDLLPLITKKKSIDLTHAQYLELQKYEISVNSQNNLFSIVKFGPIYYTVIGLIVFVFILLLILNYFQYTNIFKKIREVTNAANSVANGAYDLDIKICDKNEGDFSKLADALYLMKDVIKNNLYDLQKGKRFLVEILQGITHQLKTPIACLIFYNDILFDNKLPNDKKEFFLTNSKKQLNRMDWLIKKILELVKVDAGVIKLTYVQQSLKNTLLEAIESLDAVAKDKGVSVFLECQMEFLVNHDKHWLKEALINIIKNGIEHTKTGGKVLIKVSKNPSYFQIVIEDNGEGIKKDYLPYIFNRFYRIKTSKKSDSAGIGLALTKSIIELHSGDIIVESEFGQGTKFIITFLNEHFKHL